MTTYGSLCTGIAQLDRAIESVFGAEMCWYAEIDKDACKVLARHYPTVPNLGDIRTYDWSGVERVDLVCAGPPCQPVSVAGKRRGEDDDRWLWPDVLRCLDRLRPQWVVVENPPGIAPWLPAILRRLAGLGYVGRYGRVHAGRKSAAPSHHVDACHDRERVIAVAHASDDRRRLQPVPIARSGQETVGGDARAGVVADLHGRGLEVGTQLDGEPSVDSPDRNPRRDHADGRGHDVVADAAGSGRWGSNGRRDTRGPEDGAGQRPEPGRAGGPHFPWGRYAPAIARHERAFGRPAPQPVVEGTRSLSGDFTAWMMDVPDGWLEGLSNTAKKRLCGNAVVARQAELALWLLLDGWAAA